MPDRPPQLSTTVSPATYATARRLRREYGTLREVLTRAIALLAAQDQPVQVDDYGRLQEPDDHMIERARWNATDESH